jgi:WD40 repeat protein
MQNKWIFLPLLSFLLLMMQGTGNVASDVTVGEPITIENITQIVPVAELGRGAINDVAISPDGQRLAVETNTTLWLYALPDFNVINQIDLGDNVFYSHSIAWQPDGNLLAVVAGQKLSIWDAITGNLKFETPLDGQGVLWTPDGKTLIAVADEVELFDVETLQQIDTFDVIGNAEKVMTLSPDGTFLYVASRYSTIDSGTIYLQVWHVSSGELINTLRDLPTEISDIAVSPDGNQVAYSYYVGLVYITDAKLETMGTPLPSDEDHYIRDIAWSPDGQYLTTSLAYGGLEIWDVKKGELIQAMDLEDRRGVSQQIWLSSDEVLAVYEDGVIRRWNVMDATLLKSFDAHNPDFTSFGWSPNGSFLAVGGRDGSVFIWDVATQERIAAIKITSSGINDVTWGASDQVVAFASRKSVYLYDWRQAKLIRELVADDHDSVGNIAWSPNGHFLITQTYSHDLLMWEVATGEQVARPVCFTDFNDIMRTIVWSHDGNQFACSAMSESVGGGGTTIVSLDDTVITGDEYFQARETRNGAFDVAWSPDDSRIVIADSQGSLFIWQADGTSEASELPGHGNYAYQVSWSPTGELIAGSGDNEQLIFWDAQTGEKLHTLAIPPEITEMQFSPDDQYIALVALDEITLFGIPTSSAVSVQRS